MQREVRQLTVSGRRRLSTILALLAGAALASCATAGAVPSGPPGWKQEASEYAASARIDHPATVVAGQVAALAIEVRARGGFHLNPDYPHRFAPLTTPGVDYPAGRQGAEAFATEPCAAADMAPCALRLVAPFTVAAASAATVGGELAFGACDADRCIIEKLAIALPVRVLSAARPRP